MADERTGTILGMAGDLIGSAAGMLASATIPTNHRRETRNTVRRSRTNTGTVRRTVKPCAGLCRIDGWIRHQQAGVAEGMVFSQAAIAVQVMRKRRRLTFEMDRAAKTKEAIEGLIASRRTPWYRWWWMRFDRNKYYAGGGKKRAA